MEYAATMFDTLAGLFDKSPGPAMLLVGILMLAGARVQRFRNKTPAPTTSYLKNHPTVALWYVVSVLLVLAGVVILILTPFIAKAGIFGLGEVASAVADTSIAAMELKFKTDVLRVVQASVGVILVLICLIFGVGTLWISAILGAKYADLGKAAMRDNEITLPEQVVLGVQGFITVAVIGTLLPTGVFLIYIVWTGLAELVG